MTKWTIGGIAVGASLLVLGSQKYHHILVDPPHPTAATVVFLEVTAEGKTEAVIEMRTADQRPERAAIRPGETASTVVGFWGRAWPIDIALDGKVVWSGPVTTSLGGPNHLRLVVRDGVLTHVTPEVDPTIWSSPPLSERQVGHIPFRVIPE